MQDLEVAVIGSGPAGLTAGIYLSRAKIKTTLFTGFNLGGQLMYTRDIENFPGFPDGMRGPEFMLNLQKQAAKFGTEVKHEQITKVDLSARPFKLWVNAAKEPSYQAKVVLIATGANSMMLNVPGEKEFLGRGVSICAVCDAAFYKDKVTFVIGGGDSALEDALALTKFTDQITLVHRRDAFKASKIMQERVLNHPNIKVIWNASVKEIRGDKQQLKELVLIENGQEKTYPADGVFVAIGHRPTTQLFTEQVALDERGYLLLNQQSEYPAMSSVAGVFGAGDVADSKYRQAVVAAGAGAMAALDIERWLEGQKS